MLNDFEMNKVLVSDLLRSIAPKAFKGIKEACERFNVPFGELEGTQDIWCRDYMPLQVDAEQYQKYIYAPDYLLKSEEDRATITDGASICTMQFMKPKSKLSGIIIDGGNVVKCDYKIIMTSKVFEENPEYTVCELSESLQSALFARLVILPWDPSEVYGHSDGICRYVGNDTVLMTNYRDYDRQMAERYIRILSKHFNKVVELKFDKPRPYKHSWAYINWLQTEQMLAIPSFGRPEDQQAFNQILSLMPEYADKAVMIDCRELVKMGGALNCCTWTIKK